MGIDALKYTVRDNYTNPYLAKAGERKLILVTGTLKLIGAEEDTVYHSMKELLEKPELYRKMSKAANPYGDGTSCIQVADIIEKILR